MSKIVRIPEEKRLDRLLDLCRVGAVKDGVTVLIERRKGHDRVPLLEITPHGDIREVSAPSLRVSLFERFQVQYLDAMDVDINIRPAARSAAIRFAMLLKSAELTQPEAQGRKSRKRDRRQQESAA